MTENQSGSALLNLVGLLYEAASDMSRWGLFLREGADYFGAQYVNLIHLDAEHPELSFSLLSGFEHFDLETRQAGARKQLELQGEDPRMIHVARHPNKPVRCTDIMPHEQFRATRVYRELLQPVGIEYSLMVQYSDRPGNFTGISFHRGPDHPPFSEQDCGHLGDLLPHLRRALAIQQRIHLLGQQLQAAQGTLDAIQPAIILTDERGRVEFANTSAQELLDARDGIELQDGMLSLPERRHAQLVEALAHVADSGGHFAFNIVRGWMKTPLQCLVTRLKLDETATSPNLIARPRLALYLTDPDKPIETSEQLLQRLFGLTAAEARVLDRLSAGLNVEDIAQGSGVSPATVRVQIKALFKKTNTRRQVDLIQQVTTSPLWIARNQQAVGNSNAVEERRLGV